MSILLYCLCLGGGWIKQQPSEHAKNYKSCVSRSLHTASHGLYHQNSSNCPSPRSSDQWWLLPEFPHSRFQRWSQKDLMKFIKTLPSWFSHKLHDKLRKLLDSFTPRLCATRLLDVHLPAIFLWKDDLLHSLRNSPAIESGQPGRGVVGHNWGGSNRHFLCYFSESIITLYQWILAPVSFFYPWI